MPSDTNSSTSDDDHDLDPNPQSIQNQLASVTLNLTLSDADRETHGVVNQNTLIALEDQTGEGRESSEHGFVWGRTVSELDIDGPSSPSSSGYAGERGSSSATSGSLIDDVVEHDEIEELSNVVAVDDGISDSQMSWLPGKRHETEVCIFTIFVNWFENSAICWAYCMHVLGENT